MRIDGYAFENWRRDLEEIKTTEICAHQNPASTFIPIVILKAEEWEARKVLIRELAKTVEELVPKKENSAQYSEMFAMIREITEEAK